MTSAANLAGAFSLVAALAAMLLPLVVPLSTVVGSAVSFAYGTALFVLYCFVRHPIISNLLLLTAMAGVALGFIYALTCDVCGDLASVAAVPVLSLTAASSVIPPLYAI